MRKVKKCHFWLIFWGLGNEQHRREKWGEMGENGRKWRENSAWIEYVCSKLLSL